MLASLTSARIPTGVIWELLVVDNNSTDQTKMVVDSFVGRLPIRYLFEGRQGKAHACNSALAVATGDLLFFTDDDAVVQEGWIEVMWATANQHPEIGFFGGKVVPIWEHQCPEWFDLKVTPELACVIPSVDEGDSEFGITGEGFIPVGANMCVRRSVFENIGLFCAELGPRKDDGLPGEDSDVCLRAIRAGFAGLYVPEAVVKHPASPERTTKGYIWKYQYRYGRSVVLTRPPLEKENLIAGCPRWIWRRLLQHGVTLLKASIAWREPHQVREMARFAFYLGQCVGNRKLNKTIGTGTLPTAP